MSSMKWEKPVLQNMNAMDSASAGCASGSVNADWGGCTNGGQNSGAKSPTDHSMACVSGSSNSVG